MTPILISRSAYVGQMKTGQENGMVKIRRFYYNKRIIFFNHISKVAGVASENIFALAEVLAVLSHDGKAQRNNGCLLYTSIGYYTHLFYIVNDF